MTEEKRILIKRPTIKYEITQTLGRYPKQEVTIKFSGDAELVAEALTNDRYQEIFNMARHKIANELVELRGLLESNKE